MLLKLVLLTVLLECNGVRCAYIPFYPDNYAIDTAEYRGLSYPDDRRNTGNCPQAFHFIGRINFFSTDNFLIGSADTLYMLNGSSLTCINSFTWTTDSSFSALCNNRNDVSCHNFIRLYQTFPSNSSLLLVCGTQSGVSPQCRTLEITEDQLLSPTSSFNASNGLISNFPELNSFGEFRRNSNADTVFFSSGFYQLDLTNANIGQDFNITFHNVEYNSGTQSLSTSELISVKADRLWLNFPVTFVDYYRADYGSGFEFYFVFLRERVSQELVYSRLVRICRNDPGRSGRFTTFVKARIFCKRAVPSGRNFVGTIDYQYNDITSMVFNENGRYAEGENWGKMMYGAFSGAKNGPPGTAICGYCAENTGNRDRGIFDIFREDLLRNEPVENGFLMCFPSGRPEPFDNDVLIVESIDQIGQDPLLVLDGITVTKLVLDRVCVIRSSDRTQCQNQDILFLGTNSGKIMKVVFATTASSFQPVIAEEISLADDSSIDDMVLRDTSGVKSLFVSTKTKVYTLPLERCSRFQGCMDCIGARDPYCVWNNVNKRCESASSHLSASNQNNGVVPSSEIWQNVHNGSVPECNAEIDCEVVAQAVDYQTIKCIAGCNNTNGINISTSLPSAVRVSCTDNIFQQSRESECVRFQSDQALGLRVYECTVESSFSAAVQTPSGPPVEFDDGLYDSCNQTACKICVQMVELTDAFFNYGFQVHYSDSPNGMSLTSPLVSLSESECIVISSLSPGGMLQYVVELHNNISSLNSSMRIVNLLDGFAGPVNNLMASEVTNISVTLMWSSPNESNGTISGYSVYANNSTVVSCSMRYTATQYPIEYLLPFTDYLMTVHACNGAGESDSPSSIRVKTLCGPSSPVVNVRIEDITSNSMMVLWDMPERYNGDINNLEYSVTAIVYEIQNPYSSENMLTQNFYQFTSISPRTLCCLEIQAVTTCGSSFLGVPYSICGETITPSPESVTNLRAPESSIGIQSFDITWAPPRYFNTTPVMYDVRINNRVIENLTTTYLHINNLEPCTTYNVTVYVYSSLSTSPSTPAAASISVATKPPLPPPPQNPTFISQFVITWSPPLDDSCNRYNIQSYRVLWICNELNGENVTNSTSVAITVNEMSFGLGWCTAQIQSCDGNMRCGNFSHQAIDVISDIAPSQPRCFLQTESNNSVSISFSMSQPFIADDFKVEWIFNGILNSSNYSDLSSNIIDLRVVRNTTYNFELRICNSHGCSLPCELEFTTMDIPLPPQNTRITSVTNTTAVIEWDLSKIGLSYSISITSSCPTGNMLIGDIFTSSYTINNLCPYSNYTVALRTNAHRNMSSQFGDVFQFSTLTGIPSAPRYVTGTIDQNRKLLIITWVVPSELNGNINSYEIVWSPTISAPCTNESSEVRFHKTNNATTFEYFIQDIQLPIKSFAVCVRALTTDRTFGSWGEYRRGESDQSGLSTENTDDCDTLTAVACVAALTVVSSLVMSIVLAISVVQRGWFCSKEKQLS